MTRREALEGKDCFLSRNHLSREEVERRLKEYGEDDAEAILCSVDFCTSCVSDNWAVIRTGDNDYTIVSTGKHYDLVE